MLVARRLARAVAVVARRPLSLPAHQVVGMPALSPTMETGTIAAWKAARRAEIRNPATSASSTRVEGRPSVRVVQERADSAATASAVHRPPPAAAFPR